jgi:hypothetical protein
MHPSEIQDWQFGQLRWERGWGWCSRAVEWKSGLSVGMAVQADLTESNTLPKQAREMFDALRTQESDFVSLAAEMLLEGLNEIMENFDDADWPADSQSFADHIRLWWVSVSPDDESELQYVTGGPLLRIIISPDLTLADAFLD